MAQSYQDWEWIIVLNGGNKWSPPVADPRIKIVVADSSVTGVGAATCAAMRLSFTDYLAAS